MLHPNMPPFILIGVRDDDGVVLRYDMVELWEMGGGAECRLRKLQNGIRVFHYVG